MSRALRDSTSALALYFRERECVYRLRNREEGEKSKELEGGGGDREMPSTKAISSVRDCRRASERRGSSTLSSCSGALGRFTVTSGSRTKALISVPGRQVPNCRFKGVYPR